MAKNKNHHLFKRGDTWYLKKRVNGQWIKKALSTSVTKARRKRDEHLRNFDLYGDIHPPQEPREGTETDPGLLFGEVAEKWAKIKTAQIKGSSMRDYRSSMNLHVLPRFRGLFGISHTLISRSSRRT